MSIHIMKSVWDCRLPEGISKNRRSTVKLVLLKLADNASDNGKCWPSMERIAHEADMSVRSVIRCINELESCNIIKRETKWIDRKKHNTYFINTPLLSEIANPYKRETSQYEEDNPFLTSDSLSSTSDSLSNVVDSLSHKPSLNHQRTINLNHKRDETSRPTSNDLKASQEDKFFIDQLDEEDFKHCHNAMSILKHFKRSRGAKNIYTGNLTLEDWSNCEGRLEMVCDGYDDADQLLENIYKERGCAKRETVSLPFMLMCDIYDMEDERFADLAVNHEMWVS